MLRHRDTKRKNRANLAVQGCLYSKLNLSSLEKLKTMVTSNEVINVEEASKLIDIAEKTNLSMVDKFTTSQAQICKYMCMRYASEQYSSVQNAHQNGEDLQDNDAVSKHIVSKEIVDVFKQLQSDNCTG